LQEIWFRGENGVEILIENPILPKINESKVWINNQLSEIPNEDKVMINQNQSTP
jgi:hypothetical protein